MKGRQTALLPGNGDKVGYWLTPPDLMKKLDDEFHFDFDACPYPRPDGFNGLKEEWGRSTWVNPPFSSGRTYGEGVSSWFAEAIRRRERYPDRTIVLISHVFRWMSAVVNAGAEVRSVGGVDVAWRSPEGGVTPTPSPALLFILRPRP